MNVDGLVIYGTAGVDADILVVQCLYIIYLIIPGAVLDL